MKRILFAFLVILGVAPSAAPAAPVILITIDGLLPDDILAAEEKGVAVPHLRRFLKEGAFARGVEGVLPTLTLPSHTSLITGVAPARHGIVANNRFDPREFDKAGLYLDGSEIKAETLWNAAAKAGLTTANINWPVSDHAAGIRWNLTGFSGAHNSGAAAELKAELERAVGTAFDDPVFAGDLGRDLRSVRFAAAMMALHRPDFLTVYLTALDNEEHRKGPDAPDSLAVLERIDALVGDLLVAVRENYRDAAVAVVSDHGMQKVNTDRAGVNLYRPFVDAGLIEIDGAGKVTGWTAMPWFTGGSAAIVLARTDDGVLVSRVRKLLKAVAADPGNGIAHVAEKDEIDRLGGNPAATFYVDLVPGYVTDVSRGPMAPLVGPPPIREKRAPLGGMHGYFPALPAMRSTFMVMGPDIAAGKDLGTIDIRSVAPTLAKLLDVSMPAAEAPAVDLR
nr:ectonucleotide pyrophosphatase/phosphodiesterase [Sphingomonas sp. Y57]